MPKLHAIYFSATDTTHHCVESFCQGFGSRPDTSINLADDFAATFPEIADSDVAVIAVPVYGGRVPRQVATALERLKGNNASAIAMVVYGNRDYDDALLELTDILHRGNFRIAGAGAFIGQHSIFPKVAKARPDSSDEQKLRQFGKECESVCRNGFSPDQIPFIKGNRPYKKSGGVPLHPQANETDCVKCAKCARLCPVSAIPADKPFVTDTAKCISCGRCIAACTPNARRYSGTAYSLTGLIFKSLFSKRKEPEWTTSK
ncbi:MAG: 4Fe-4S binding protein [Bacteroides sp.]|nr:4Fe-4S binding protein [Alistipes timonensis]MCM1311088.1 4Fe-4S binding protein [Bacteroides sp.]MCM1405697.1 4Fe-4S binding protein [[Clostridium] fimetarium]